MGAEQVRLDAQQVAVPDTSTCNNTSTRARSCTSTAIDSALMRAPVRGPSGMVTTSTPRFASRAAPSSASAGACPRGGSSSMARMNWPLTSFFASVDFSWRSIAGLAFGWLATGLFASPPPARASPGAIDFAASAICRICSGVVPQHPPTKRTPEAMKRRAYDAMYSGEQR